MTQTTDERLREATREANGVVKDLERVIREGRQLVKEIDAAASKAVEARIGEAIKEGLDEYRGTVRRAMDEAVVHIDKRFDEYANILMYGNKQGRGESLQEMAERQRHQLGKQP